MPEHQLHHSGLDIVSTRTDTRRLGGSCEGTSVPRPTGLVAARVGNSQRGFLWVSSGYRRAPLSRFERGRIMRSLCSASLQHLDGVIDVALLEVKYFHQYLEREAFKKLPKGMTLAAGIVDENRARQEGPESHRRLGARGLRGPVVGRAVLRVRPASSAQRSRSAGQDRTHGRSCP